MEVLFGALLNPSNAPSLSRESNGSPAQQSLSYAGDDFLDQFFKDDLQQQQQQQQHDLQEKKPTSSGDASASHHKRKKSSNKFSNNKKGKNKSRPRQDTLIGRAERQAAKLRSSQQDNGAAPALPPGRQFSVTTTRGILSEDVHRTDIAQAASARLVELRKLTSDPRRKPLYVPPSHRTREGLSSSSSSQQSSTASLRRELSRATTPAAAALVASNARLMQELDELVRQQSSWGGDAGDQTAADTMARYQRSMDERTIQEGMDRLAKLQFRQNELREQRAAAVVSFLPDEDDEDDDDSQATATAEEFMLKLDGIHSSIVRRHMTKVRQRLHAELVDQQLAVETHEYIMARLTGLTTAAPAGFSTMTHRPSVLESKDEQLHKHPYKMLPQRPRSPPRHYEGASKAMMHRLDARLRDKPRGANATEYESSVPSVATSSWNFTTQHVTGHTRNEPFSSSLPIATTGSSASAHLNGSNNHKPVRASAAVRQANKKVLALTSKSARTKRTSKDMVTPHYASQLQHRRMSFTSRSSKLNAAVEELQRNPTTSGMSAQFSRRVAKSMKLKMPLREPLKVGGKRPETANDPNDPKWWIREILEQ